jgi:hypothetical protein
MGGTPYYSVWSLIARSEFTPFDGVEGRYLCTLREFVVQYGRIKPFDHFRLSLSISPPLLGIPLRSYIASVLTALDARGLDQKLLRLVQRNIGLEEVHMSTHEGELIGLAVEVIKLWDSSPNPLRLTILERMKDR